MSRRRPPVRRWHVGDRCLTPEEIRVDGGPTTRTLWSAGLVVATRADRVVVRRYRWEHEYPWWALRVPARLMAGWRFR